MRPPPRPLKRASARMERAELPVHKTKTLRARFEKPWACLDHLYDNRATSPTSPHYTVRPTPWRDGCMMIFHEGRHEVVGVIIARLHAQGEGTACRMRHRLGCNRCGFSCSSRKLSASPWSTRRGRVVGDAGSLGHQGASIMGGPGVTGPRPGIRQGPCGPTGSSRGRRWGRTRRWNGIDRGFFKPMVNAPWPPMEWPKMPWRSISSGNSEANQRRQLFHHVAVHLIVLSPRGSAVAFT